MVDTVAKPVMKLKRIAKGRKPQYFHDPATDKLHSMVLALTQELSVARDRIDTLERLIERAGLFPASAVEAYLPTAEEAAVRSDRRAAMLSRVFRATEKEMHDIAGAEVAAPEDIQRILT
jgi:hypothetical protein